MKEKIEAKIEAHVKAILKKDYIDWSDYQVLVGELARLDVKEKAEKWEADKENRMESMMKMLTCI